MPEEEEKEQEAQEEGLYVVTFEMIKTHISKL